MNPIHEGTNGVQALDLLGRKVRQDDGAGLLALLARMRATEVAAADDPTLGTMPAELSAAIERLEQVTATLLRATVEPARALANASAYLDLMSRTVIAWLWLRQARTASRALSSVTPAAEEQFLRGKVQAARYWYGWELPRTVQLGDLLARGDATPFEVQDAWF